MPRKPKTLPQEEVTDKSTKAEILAAYRELLDEKAVDAEPALFAQEPPPMRTEPKKDMEPLSLDAIVTELASLKLHVGKHLADMEQRLSEESLKLAGLKETLQAETARLKEVHDIEAAAVKLDELRENQAREKTAFEQVLAETRAAWEKEKREHDLLVKEREAQEKKERTREEEDYQYQVKLKRQREKDAFESEMAEKRRTLEEESAAREVSLKTREESVKAQERELEELRKKVEAFPAQLDKEVRAAEKAAEKATEERLKLEKLLLEKDIESERELFKLTISSLQEKAKEQENRIKALERDLKESMAQSQSVAARAIEGIAGMRHAPAPPPEPPRESPGEGKR